MSPGARGRGPAGETAGRVTVETDADPGTEAPAPTEAAEAEPEGPELIDEGIPVGVPAGAAAGTEPAADGFAHGTGEILADTAALVAERDEYLGALQRLQADFANYRKRVQRQEEEQAARAALDLVTKLLPVLDTLDLAEAHLGGSDTDEAKALLAARTMLVDTLGKEGLERVDAAEVAFDPVVHDAVAHAPAEPAGEEGEAAGGHEVVVDEVLRSGYRWRGQVVRPAMVRVRG